MKRLRSVTIGLILAMLCTSVTPGFAASESAVAEVQAAGVGDDPIDTTEEWVIDYQLGEQPEEDADPSEIPDLSDEQMQQMDWGTLSVSTVQQISDTYDRQMLQVAAYFYPRLRNLLSIEEKQEQNKWTRESALQKYAVLTEAQKIQVQSLTPIKLESDPEEEEAVASPAFSAQATTYKFTETQMKNVFTRRVTTKPVDDFYRTANLVEKDLFLQGKHGMDVTILRQYSSLDSKTQLPQLEYDEADNEWSNQKEKKLFVNEYVPFAKGWSFNIPTFEYSQVVATSISKSNDIYTYSYDEEAIFDQIDRYLITLDDGNTIQYEYDNNLRKETMSTPYENVNIIRHADMDDLDVEVDGYRYEFRKTGSTQQVTKTNIYGDEIVYTLSKDEDDEYVVEIKDTYNRYIVMERDDAGGIQNLKVFKNATDKNNGTNPIYELEYDVEYSSSSNPANSTYSKLNSVTQINDSDSKVLATYLYDTMSSEFNLLLDYSFPESEFDEVDFEYDEYVDQDNENRRKTLSYLNLTDVTYPVSGLSYHYYYENYNDAPSDPRNRGVIRLYQDPYALSYISYRPVVEVDIEYNEYGKNSPDSTSISYSLSDLANLKTWEIWKKPKNDLEMERLHNAEERHGDLVASTEWSGGQQITYLYQVNNEGNPLLKRVTTRHTRNNSFPVFSAENGSQTFSYTPVRHVSYAYLPGDKSKGTRDRTKPAYMYEFVENTAASEAVMNYLLNPVLSTTGSPGVSGLSSYANITSYTYDETFGDLKKVTTPDGVSVSYTYKSNDLYNYRMLTSETRQSSDGALVDKTTYTDADGDYLIDSETTTHKYVRNGSSVTDQVTRDYSYNSNDQISAIKETASDGSTLLTENTTYDKYGHVTKQILRSISLGNGESDLVISTSYVTGLDLINTQTFPDGSYVDYDYDVLHRLTKETFVNGADEKEIIYTYDDDLRKVTKEIKVNGQANPDGLHVVSYYTPYGDVAYSAEVSSEGERPLVLNVYELQPYGMQLEESTVFGDEDRTTEYEYYADNRLRTVTDEDGEVTTYLYANTMTSSSSVLPQKGEYVIHPNGLTTLQLYNNKGQLIRSDEKTGDEEQTRKTTYTYDGLGNLSTKVIANQDGRTRVWIYYFDTRDQLVYLRDAERNTYSYQYDHNGNLTDVTENGLTTTKNYFNELGWKIKEVNVPSGESESTSYLLSGDVDTFTDKAGNTHEYRYTPFYEVEEMAVYAPDRKLLYTETFTYDPWTRLLREESNSDGQSITYDYDSYQRPTSFTTFERTYSIGYTDGDSSIDSFTYPDGTRVDYNYDDKGRLLSVDAPKMGLVKYSYSTNDAGSEYGIKYPNDLTGEKTYNSFGEVRETTFRLNGEEIFEEKQAYDGFGNVSEIEKVGQTSSGAFSYQYDKIDRLTSETSPSVGTKSYTYDDRGNRETFEGAAPSFPDEQRFTYDALNRLVSFSSTANEQSVEASYTYYPGGLRASKTVNGDTTRYVYWNGKVIEELDEDNNLKARNIWGNELLYRETESGESEQKSGYYLTNGHGDVVNIISEDGEVINQYDYDSWGNLQAKVEGMENPFTYAGEIYDYETGLYYLRARYYDPSVGRFITEDTYKGQVDNPLSLNRYTYVHNNPLRFVDPTGNEAIEGSGGYFGGNHADLVLSWGERAVTYADAYKIDYDEAVEAIVPANLKQEVHEVVYQIGATRTQRIAGDVPDLGMASSGGVIFFAGTIKNTGKSVNQAVKNGSINSLPNNAKAMYSKYEKNGWQGSVSGQTQGTAAGSKYFNKDGKLPTVDGAGNPVTYKEFDINNKLPNQPRDAERFVRGSDGSVYYTNDHYISFTKIK